MRKNICIALAVGFCTLLSGCEKMFMETSSPKDPYAVFDDVWSTLNEKYSYFELKNIDWDAARETYRGKITPQTSTIELYEVLYDLLYTLCDGHVNLSAGFDYARNWEWYLDAPANFDYNIITRHPWYLGKNYWISGGLKNQILYREKAAEGRVDHYGYIYYESFNSSVSMLDFVLQRLDMTKGLILDLRNNGGGSMANAEAMADRFADQKRLTYITYYKTGPGHGEFSRPYPHYSSPSGELYTKPVIVLTNRMCYSATSFFVTMAKEFPNVVVLGDSTGGGAGLPVDYLLANNWRLRYSSTRSTDALGNDFELGVEPDEKCDMDMAKAALGIDTIIERAVEIIDEKTKTLNSAGRAG